jgi:hypothetical protein
MTVIACAGLFAAAALVPAPADVLPLVVAVCIAGPMVAAWELRGAVATLRRGMDRDAVAALRRHLERLPETRHPLGF